MIYYTAQHNTKEESVHHDKQKFCNQNKRMNKKNSLTV